MKKIGKNYQDECKTDSAGEIYITEGSHTQDIVLLLQKKRDLNIKNTSSLASTTTNPINDHLRSDSSKVGETFPHQSPLIHETVYNKNTHILRKKYNTTSVKKIPVDNHYQERNKGYQYAIIDNHDEGGRWTKYGEGR